MALPIIPSGNQVRGTVQGRPFGVWSPQMFGAKADGVAGEQGAIGSALSAAAVRGDAVYLPAGTYRISATTTLSGASALEFAPGATLSVDTGVTLTLAGIPVVAERWQIFAGAGTVLLSGRPAERVLPEWFGAAGDGVANDTAALVKAFDAIAAEGGGIELAGVYPCDTDPGGIPTLQLRSNYRVRGLPGARIVCNTTPTSMGDARRVLGISDQTTTLYSDILLDGVVVDGAATSTSGNAFPQCQSVFLYGAPLDVMVEPCDAGWVSDDPTNVTVTEDTTDVVEGTASALATIGAGFTTGRVFHKDLAADVDLGEKSVLVLDVKSDVATAGGDLRLQAYDASGGIVFDEELRALPADTWTQAFVYLTPHCVDIHTLTVYRATDLGAQAIHVDAIRSRVPTISNVTLRDCRVINSWSTGVYGRNLKNLKVEGGIYTSNRRAGIEFGGNVDDLVITGVTAQGSEEVTGYDGSLRVEAAQGYFVKNVRILGCTADTLSVSGTGDNWGRDVMLLGNQVTHTAQVSTTDTAIISNNSFRAAPSRNGLVILACRNVTITGNQISTSLTGEAGIVAGINLAGQAGQIFPGENVRVAHNIVRNRTTGELDTNVRGLSSQLGFRNLHITDNYFAGFSQAVQVGADENVVVRDNDGDGSAVHGVAVSGAALRTAILGRVPRGTEFDVRVTAAATSFVLDSLAASTSLNTGITYARGTALTGSASVNFPSLAAGASASQNVTVNGAQNDGTWVATASHSAITGGGWVLHAQVTAANTVTATLVNNTGGTVDLPSGTLRVEARKVA